VEVGDYYARIERPAGNGYKQGKNVKVEYHIQKALVSIQADTEQRFSYDGKPKRPALSTAIVTLEGESPADLELLYTYFSGDKKIDGSPSARGAYRVEVLYKGGARTMGASKEITLIIE
jgi:hypothetical protein